VSRDYSPESNRLGFALRLDGGRLSVVDDIRVERYVISSAGSVDGAALWARRRVDGNRRTPSLPASGRASSRISASPVVTDPHLDVVVLDCPVANGKAC
jgi:hypothetical protein